MPVVQRQGGTNQMNSLGPWLSAFTRRRALAAAPLLVAAGSMSRAADRRDQAAPTVGEPGSRIDMLIRFTKEPSGEERGVERVTYSFNVDGTITMSARSESFDPAVVRDVVYLLGADFRPQSCYVQIADRGRPVGSGWFRLSARNVEVEADTAKGRVREEHAVPEPVKALVAHPVSTDVHVSLAADRSQPGAVTPAEGVYLTSSDPYGRTGPELVRADVAVDYLGVEEIVTPLGRMAADHSLLYLRGNHGRFEPFQDLWCAAGTPVFLKAFARPPVATRYEIAQMSITGPRNRAI